MLPAIIGTLPAYLGQGHIKDQFPHVKVVNNGAVCEITLMPQVMYTLFSKLARDYSMRLGYRSTSDLGFAMRDLKKIATVEDHGFLVERAKTQRRLGADRGIAWILEIHLDSVEALIESRHETNTFVGMDSGEEIDVTPTPEELEQVYEESGTDRGDADWPDVGDQIQG